MSDDQQLDMGFEQVNADLQRVPLDKIEPPEYTPRSKVDASISNLGLVSVPVVQQTDEGGDFRYTIVDGRRRIQVARDGDADEIDAYVLPPGVGAEADALTAALNLVRSPSPLQEAQAIAALLDQGYTEDALERLGFDRNTIRKRNRLWHAPDEIKEGVRDGDIAEGTAERVANLEPHLQDRCVEKYREDGKLYGRHIGDIRQAARNENAEQLPDDLFGEDTSMNETPSGDGAAGDGSDPTDPTPNEPVAPTRSDATDDETGSDTEATREDQALIAVYDAVQDALDAGHTEQQIDNWIFAAKNEHDSDDEPEERTPADFGHDVFG